MPTVEDNLRRYLDAVTKRVDPAEVRGEERRPRRLGRHSPTVALAAAAVAAVLVGAIGLLAAGDDDPNRIADRPGESAASGAELGRWEPLPDELRVADPHAELIWTGDELVGVYPENGGNDVAVQVWNRDLTEVRIGAPSGMSWRAFPAIVWTGSEVLVIGGSNGPGIDVLGGAYDPRADTWTFIEPAPGFEPGRSEPISEPGVWTGSEVVFWDAALAYDPGTDSWRALAVSPLSTRSFPAMAANESHVFVWGGCPTGITNDDCGVDDAGLRDGAIYDVNSDTWSRLPDGGPIPGAELEAIRTGSEFLVVASRNRPLDSGSRVAGYEPVAGRWRLLPDLPEGQRIQIEALETHLGLTLVGGGQPAIRLDQESNLWGEIGDPPLITDHAAAGWANGRLAVTGGRPAGSYVFVPRDQGVSGSDDRKQDPYDCIPVEELPVPDGLVGAPVAQVLPAGVNSALSLGDLWALPFTGPQLEGTWYAISTRVHDADGADRGVAVWIIPDSIVTYAGPADTAAIGRWRQDPASTPEYAYLFAANDLAREVAVWRPNQTIEVDVGAAGRCAQ